MLPAFILNLYGFNGLVLFTPFTNLFELLTVLSSITDIVISSSAGVSMDGSTKITPSASAFIRTPSISQSSVVTDVTSSSTDTSTALKAQGIPY